MGLRKSIAVLLFNPIPRNDKRQYAIWYILCIVAPNHQEPGQLPVRISIYACGGHEGQVSDASLKWDLVTAAHSYPAAEQEWDSRSDFDSYSCARTCFWLPSKWWSTDSHFGVLKALLTSEHFRNCEWRNRKSNGQQPSKSILVGVWADEECLGYIKHLWPSAKGCNQWNGKFYSWFFDLLLDVGPVVLSVSASVFPTA